MRTLVMNINSLCRATLLFFGVIMLSFGCSGCLKAPVLSGADVIYFGTISDGNLQTLIRLKVYNPNIGGSRLTSANVKIYYQGKLIGTSKLDSPVLLKGKDTSAIPLNSKINLGNLVGVFPGLLAVDSPKFYVEGNCRASMLGVDWNVPIKETVKLNIRELIGRQVAQTFKSDSSFQIRSLHLSRLPDLQTTRFDMMLRINNDFKFDYQLRGLQLNLYRKDGKRPLARWKMTDTVNAHAGQPTDIPLSVAVSNANMLTETRLSDVMHGGMDITLQGTADIAIGEHVFAIPIENTRHISLTSL